MIYTQIEEVPGEFTQDDLAEDDVMLLDVWDQVEQINHFMKTFKKPHIFTCEWDQKVTEKIFTTLHTHVYISMIRCLSGLEQMPMKWKEQSQLSRVSDSCTHLFPCNKTHHIHLDNNISVSFNMIMPVKMEH